jgi:sugar transferase (PEP-CTERM/EpsH1 system associated)
MGDKLRAYHFLRELSRWFDILLFALHDEAPGPEALNALQPWCKEIRVHVKGRLQPVLSALGRHDLPLQVGWFCSAAAMQELRAFQAEHQADAVFCQLIRMAEYSRGLPRPQVLDYMDAFSKGAERMSAAGPLWLRPVFAVEQRRLVRYEREVFDRFDQRLIISAQDREHMPHPQARAIKVVPNGVDAGYFHPEAAEKKYDLLFNGHMAYPPNIASATFLAREVFPLVQAARPGTTLLIAGADPARSVRNLAGGGITVIGRVPDIRPAFHASRVLVAPMLISIGLQDKILQAMAMNLPCVLSELANNALGAQDGREVLVARRPEDYATQILRLLNDEALARQIAEAGRALVLDKYDWERNVSALAADLLALIRTARP